MAEASTMGSSTPGGIWICPAMFGLWLLSIAVRWGINRYQRLHRGRGDWDHMFRSGRNG